jgi:hypothetical protein
VLTVTGWFSVRPAYTPRSVALSGEFLYYGGDTTHFAGVHVPDYPLVVVCLLLYRLFCVYWVPDAEGPGRTTYRFLTQQPLYRGDSWISEVCPIAIGTGRCRQVTPIHAYTTP